MAAVLFIPGTVLTPGACALFGVAWGSFKGHRDLTPVFSKAEPADEIFGRE